MTATAKMTATANRVIFGDWLRRFSDMGAYEPMWMMKRHGPLLIGICLNSTRSNDAYLPTFHLHNLLQPNPAIVFSARLQPPSARSNRIPLEIKVGRHANEYESAVTWMKGAIPLLGSRMLGWAEVVNWYCCYILEKRDFAVAKYCAPTFREVIKLAAWCGHLEYARRCKDEALQLMADWYPAVDLEAWQASLEGFDNKAHLDSVLDAELAKHKLVDIPVYPFDPQGDSAPSITEAYRQAQFEHRR